MVNIMTRRTGRQDFEQEEIACMEVPEDALAPRILGMTMVFSALFLLLGIGICIMRECCGTAF